MPDKEKQIGKFKYVKTGDEVKEVKEVPSTVVKEKVITPQILKMRRDAYVAAMDELDEVLAEMYPGTTWNDIQ